MSQPTSPVHSDAVDDFIDLSVVLTGFSKVELLGTGMVGVYYDTVNRIVGEREIGKLLGAAKRILGEKSSENKTNTKIRKKIMENSRFGPVARNILRLWYLGAWSQLPQQWRNDFGATSCDVDHIISPASYRESLVWIAGETHPMGARQQGFGAWAKPGR